MSVFRVIRFSFVFVYLFPLLVSDEEDVLAIHTLAVAAADV